MRQTRRFRGAGYLTDVQYLGGQLPPMASSLVSVPSSAPTATEVRPVMYSTFQAGGKTRRGERKRGGFSPSVMGSFVANAQAFVVPLAFYLAYNTLVPKTGSPGKGGKSRKANRKANRKASRKNTRK
jgi:hypothetical protein